MNPVTILSYDIQEANTVIAGVLFLFLALLCRQFFFHHPAHIGIKI